MMPLGDEVRSRHEYSVVRVGNWTQKRSHDRRTVTVKGRHHGAKYADNLAHSTGKRRY